MLWTALQSMWYYRNRLAAGKPEVLESFVLSYVKVQTAWARHPQK